MSTEREKLLEKALKDLIQAVEEMTYVDGGRLYTGYRGDCDCTDNVKPALDAAKNLLTLN